jgi:hypothetical protein
METEVENLMDLSLGEAPLRITIPDPAQVEVNAQTEMEAVGEVETQPVEAASAGGLLSDVSTRKRSAEEEDGNEQKRFKALPDIVQETDAGTAIVMPRKRSLEIDDDTEQRIAKKRSFVPDEGWRVYGDENGSFEGFFIHNNYGRLIMEVYKRLKKEKDPVKKEKEKKEFFQDIENSKKYYLYRKDREAGDAVLKKLFNIVRGPNKKKIGM